MISIISMISNSQTENEYFLVDVVPICELGIYFCVLISVCVCVCVCVCVRVSVAWKGLKNSVYLQA